MWRKRPKWLTKQVQAEADAWLDSVDDGPTWQGSPVTPVDEAYYHLRDQIELRQARREWRREWMARVKGWVWPSLFLNRLYRRKL
jgi:hypothetical protein